MTSLHIQHRPPNELTAYSRNARTHSPKQIAQIAASIREFGFNNPVLIDKHNISTSSGAFPIFDTEQKLALE